MLEAGCGVKKQKKKQKQYYEQAARKGHEGAHLRMSELSRDEL
jgi:TPR repeat protein